MKKRGKYQEEREMRLRCGMTADVLNDKEITYGFYF